jgi:catechol 2,3-dioxygenase-like lactoylglutathione lyase family enzyme
MFDHFGIKVQDLTQSKRFYTGALAPLGHAVQYEDAATVGIGPKGAPALWLSAGDARTPAHIALSAANRAAVNGFHKAALAAGGKDNGAPGLRPAYHKNYYGAFVLDPDGNNVEAVCHRPE